MSGDIQVSRVVCMQSVNWKVRRATEAATAGFCGQHSALLAVVRGVAPVSRCEAESTWEKESRRGGNFELRGPRISTTAVPPGDEAGPWTCGVRAVFAPGTVALVILLQNGNFVFCVCGSACWHAVTANGITGISCDCTFL